MASPTLFAVDRTLKRLGHNVALSRLRRNLSQAALADRIGASVNTVRRMEAGHDDPKPTPRAGLSERPAPTPP